MTKFKTLATKAIPLLAVLFVIALVATLGIGTALADESTGTVTFEGADTPVFPPEVSPGGSPSPSPGTEGVYSVPNYLFGLVTITGANMTIPNVPDIVNNNGNNANCYIRTQDLTAKHSSFNVQVKLGHFTNQANKTIAGATLKIIPKTGAAPLGWTERNPQTKAIVTNATHSAPTFNTANSTFTAGDNSAKKLISADNSGSKTAGIGEWWLATTAELYIPAAAELTVDSEYTAILNWQMVVGL